MVLTYTGSGELFNDLGKIVHRINALETLVDTTWPADQTAITDALKAGADDGRDFNIGNVAGAYAGITAQGESARRSLYQIARDRIMDKTGVIEELGLDANAVGFDDVMRELIKDMNDQDYYVDPSVAALSAITADGSNQGNGTILIDLTLDGVTAPGAFFPQVHEYGGLTSEMTVASDALVATVMSDSQANGLAEGGEIWQLTGKTFLPLFHSNAAGSGSPITLQTAHAKSLINNGEFESWSSNVPSNWTLGTNVLAGTHVIQEAAASDVHRGDYALELKGDGSLADIYIEQPLTISRLVPNKVYCLTLRYKADAAVASGDFLVQLEGTGYTAASSEKISVAAASIPTSYTLVNFYVVLPQPIPTDLKLAIHWNSTPTNTRVLHIDSLTFSEPDFFGGFSLVPVSGSNRWLNRDRLTFTATNDEAGAWQTFFKRAFGYQLRTTGTNNIADALITS